MESLEYLTLKRNLEFKKMFHTGMLRQETDKISELRKRLVEFKSKVESNAVN